LVFAFGIDLQQKRIEVNDLKKRKERKSKR
jgi:hypothetical protein